MKEKSKSRYLPKQTEGEIAQKQSQMELPPELTEALKDLPKKKRMVIMSAMVREQRSFTGPLPHPELFQGYENTLPGSAERILAMAEKEQNHRHESEDKMISVMQRQHTRGQNIGCFLAVVLSAIAFVLGFLGHDWLSGAVFTTTIVSVIIIYVLERQPQQTNDIKD